MRHPHPRPSGGSPVPRQHSGAGGGGGSEPPSLALNISERHASERRALRGLAPRARHRQELRRTAGHGGDAAGEAEGPRGRLRPQVPLLFSGEKLPVGPQGLATRGWGGRRRLRRAPREAGAGVTYRRLGAEAQARAGAAVRGGARASRGPGGGGGGGRTAPPPHASPPRPGAAGAGGGRGRARTPPCAPAPPGPPEETVRSGRAASRALRGPVLPAAPVSRPWSRAPRTCPRCRGARRGLARPQGPTGQVR